MMPRRVCRSANVSRNPTHANTPKPTARKFNGRCFSTLQDYCTQYPLHAFIRHAAPVTQADGEKYVEEAINLTKTLSYAVNTLDDRGHDPLFYVINNLPHLRCPDSKTHPIAIQLADCLIEQDATLKEEQFHLGSALTHIIHEQFEANAAGRNRLFSLSKLLIDRNFVDINKQNHGVSPLRQIFIKCLMKNFDLSKLLIQLFRKGVIIDNKEFLHNSPYHQVLSILKDNEQLLKFQFLSVFLLTQNDKSSINALNHQNMTPLDVASQISNRTLWRNAIITQLHENGGKTNLTELKEWKVYHPTYENYMSSKEKGKYVSHKDHPFNHVLEGEDSASFYFQPVIISNRKMVLMNV